MNIVERVQAILLKPVETWPVIEQESTDAQGIYKNYLIYLAAIPAVAGFIGMSLVGAGAMGMSFRVPIVAGLGNMVVGYVLSLVMIYVLAMITNALAPSFQGEKNQLNALKLIAFGSTAGMVGGVFSLIPMLSVLGLLAALYSIYLVYTGIPVLMKAPKEKAAVYTAVVVVCGIVAGIILGAASALFSGGGPGYMMGGGRPDAGDVSIKLPGTEITLDTAKLEEASKKMEAASKKMEEAQARGDSAAAGQAMNEMMGAALGGKGGKPFAPDVLQGYVPATLAGLSRSTLEARSDNAMGMNFTSVTAEYEKDDRVLEVKVQDIGAVPALAMAMGAWAQSTVNRETQEEVERIYQKDGVSIKEEYRKDGSRAEMALMLPNGVMVEVSGNNLDMDAVRSAVATLDTKGMAGLQRQP
ncbi:Yip1 family protein [Hydrogenophaga taeniospiralis]|nr:Yip1 family protein [Hydrogenophaga taeniospiralis]